MSNYKKYNIDATDENVLQSIKENKYGRMSSVKNFIKSLDMIDSNVFISLDARWGEGKTFYVRQIEWTLKYMTKRILKEDTSNMEEYFINTIKEDDLISKSYFPIYYNAWLYDCHNDPLLSLLYIIVKEGEKNINITKINSKSAIEKIIDIMPSIKTRFCEVNIKQIKDEFRGVDLLNDIKTAEEIRESVKRILDDIIVESTQKLIIIVDELDRCKPSYAIEMLERLKHYFDDDRIIFIFSINKEQLGYTISKYYGQGFDSTAYLNKFFDISICLPSVKQKNIDVFSTSYEQYYVKNIVNELSEYYNLSLRDAIIYQQNMETTSKQFFDDRTQYGWVMSLFVPIIKVLEIVNQSAKNEFMNGNSDIFMTLCKEVKSINKLVCRFADYRVEENEKFDNGLAKWMEIYRYIFGGLGELSLSFELSDDIKEECIAVCNGEKL